MTKDCQICGSRFGDLVCIYCTKSICSSCLVQDKNKCIKCARMKKTPYKFLRRNYPFILLFVVFWFFTAGVYPFPYFLAIGKSLDPAIMQPILIATGLMAIPFTFLLVAWKKRPPTK
jgi:hypothetical protein